MEASRVITTPIAIFRIVKVQMMTKYRHFKLLLDRSFSEPTPHPEKSNSLTFFQRPLRARHSCLVDKIDAIDLNLPGVSVLKWTQD
jgi:hypothetical protein